jgi:ABC-2 type transport system ATP-binding protein
MIELKDLTKRYTRIVAVNDLNLMVPKGEIFGFIGPNGAGKTTTIKMMGGILSPTTGSITICGFDMATEAEKAKRKIGFIPDRPYLYEKLTGMEFLRFTALLFGIERSVFQKKAEACLQMFSIYDWAEDLIESYSHGMRQRLVMAAAILHDPQVIIVDEPMVGLDPRGIILVKNLLKQLARGGVTIFMSTHSLNVAEDVCDRIGVIHRGNLVAVGTLDELKEKSHNKNVDLEAIFIALTTEGIRPAY